MFLATSGTLLTVVLGRAREFQQRWRKTTIKELEPRGICTRAPYPSYTRIPDPKATPPRQLLDTSKPRIVWTTRLHSHLPRPFFFEIFHVSQSCSYATATARAQKNGLAAASIAVTYHRTTVGVGMRLRGMVEPSVASTIKRRLVRSINST